MIDPPSDHLPIDPWDLGSCAARRPCNRRSYNGGVFSVTITTKVTIPNLDRQWIEIPCPLCELTTPTTLGAIRWSDVVVCRGCHANIRLIDHMASFHRFKRKFAAMLKSLER
jgi:hypothetical protein